MMLAQDVEGVVHKYAQKQYVSRHYGSKHCLAATIMSNEIIGSGGVEFCNESSNISRYLGNVPV